MLSGENGLEKISFVLVCTDTNGTKLLSQMLMFDDL